MLEFASPLQRFCIACRRGDEKEAKAMLREYPDIMKSMTPDDHRAISDAAWNGDAAAVALMLELGFDPRTPGQRLGDGAPLRFLGRVGGYGEGAAASP